MLRHSPGSVLGSSPVPADTLPTKILSRVVQQTLCPWDLSFTKDCSSRQKEAMLLCPELRGNSWTPADISGTFHTNGRTKGWRCSLSVTVGVLGEPRTHGSIETHGPCLPPTAPGQPLLSVFSLQGIFPQPWG